MTVSVVELSFRKGRVETISMGVHVPYTMDLQLKSEGLIESWKISYCMYIQLYVCAECCYPL